MSRTTIVLAGLASLTLLAVTAGCQSNKSADGEFADAGEVTWGNTHQFTYYPASMVYFDQQVGTWFWFEEAMWQSGPELPEWIEIDSSDAVTLRCNPEQPWITTSSQMAAGRSQGQFQTQPKRPVKVGAFRGVWVSPSSQ